MIPYQFHTYIILIINQHTPMLTTINMIKLGQHTRNFDPHTYSKDIFKGVQCLCHPPTTLDVKQCTHILDLSSFNA